ncbi:MAG: alpha/beta fold hydrolase, partial [Caldilineaceae bacterium]|nr:alpha/beta fold hydrolase [Caldilineaceae bacterium]
AHGHALRDAAIDDGQGPYPLVVLSHGFMLSPAWYHTLAEQYASYGFIVLAPDHPEEFDPTFGAMWQTLIDRPAAVSRTLDYAEGLTAPGGAMAGLIDMTKVAVVGHSYGGYTALAAAGAQYDMAAYKARCATLEADDPHAFFCMPIVPNEAAMAERAGLEAVSDGLWPSFGDPRVTAIIPMAGDSYLFDAAGLAQISAPMLAIAGGADTGTPLDWGAQPAYAYASSAQKSLVVLEGGEHMLFTTPCENQPWLSEHPYYEYFCFDPAWEKPAALDLIHHFSTAFLLATLKGDQDAHAMLLPAAVHFPGIEYATTLE